MASIPHFDIPFRFGKSAIVVDQDSYEDIANCVETIIRTPLGFRNDAIDFGFPQLEFRETPILTGDVVSLIRSQEPRADILITERPDVIDALIDRVTVQVS